MASSPAPLHQAIDAPPVRLWLLMASAPVGYLVGSAMRLDYGVLSGIVAAVAYMVAIGGYAIFGARGIAWLRAHGAVCAGLFGVLAFVTLAGLHLFTPAEDVVIAVAAGLAARALIDES
ncbi:MAG: hypothetical protein Q7T55_22135 [Solirubrobacteraceae bacterium]|nr:hypothetical protein [Solirubrobacteraceae bacterium]